jgi:hypothetical protein
MNDDNLPTEYHEYLEFLENNTDRMVAEIWANYYVPQSALEPLIEEWKNNPPKTPAECADDVEAVLMDND